MISILLAFINGFMSILFVLYEFICYSLLWIHGLKSKYPQVKDIWWDRSIKEYFAYFCGLLTFISWPSVLCILRIGPLYIWYTVSLALWSIFVVLFFATLLGPIGARRRYRILCRFGRPGHERLFAGFLPIKMMLSVRGKGAKAVLWEVLFMVLLLVLAPTFINACCHKYASNNKETFFTFPEGKIAMVVPFSRDPNNISIVDFLHYSVATITTVGYGNIAPRSYQTQLLFVSQIAMSWMYLISLFPVLLSSIKPNIGHRPTWRRGAKFKGQWIQTALTTGLERVAGNQQSGGVWESTLSSDLLASAFTYQALRNSQNLFKAHSSKMQERLNLWCKKLIPEQRDERVKAIVSLCVNDGKLDDDIVAILMLNNDLTESSVAVLLWISALLCEPLSKLSQITKKVKLPDVEQWESKYGEHWATYALVTKLLMARLSQDNSSVNSLGKTLVEKRTSAFSWYGDNLLTAICILSLKKCKIGLIPRYEAETILVEQLQKNGEGVPLVGNLDTWHTALAIDLFCSAGMSHSPIIEDAERWLTEMFNRNVYNGWSWSSDSNMLCIDSTSAALEALRHLSTNDTTVWRVIELAQETIASTRGIGSLAEFEWPTFIENNMPLHPCPIISARCLKHVVMQPDEKRKLAQALIVKVHRNRWVSPWFDRDTICHGLVLWHLSPWLPGFDPAKELTAKLTIDAQRVGSLGDEECGAIALGLIGSFILYDNKTELLGALDVVIDSLVSREDEGLWRGSPTGIFGFDRFYSDDHWTTVLVLKALFEYSKLGNCL